jgi:hypothetical protein
MMTRRQRIMVCLLIVSIAVNVVHVLWAVLS